MWKRGRSDGDDDSRQLDVQSELERCGYSCAQSAIICVGDNLIRTAGCCDVTPIHGLGDVAKTRNYWWTSGTGH